MGERPLEGTTPEKLTCSNCPKELGAIFYRVGSELFCQDCYCRNHGVCG